MSEPKAIDNMERDDLVIGLMLRATPEEWISIVRYFSPSMAEENPRLLAELVAMEAQRRAEAWNDNSKIAKHSPSDYMAGVLNDAGLKLAASEESKPR